MEQHTFRAMGCQIMALVDADGPRAARLVGRVPEWFGQWERCLSRFRPDSELMRLNARPGRFVRVSRTLWAVLRAAQRAERASAGLVRPGLLEALAAAGYTRSFAPEDRPPAADGGARLPAPPYPAAPARPGALELRSRPRAAWLAPGARLDLGGVAKGWAAQEAVRRLRCVGPALLDAAGDIALSGPRAGGAPWALGVADPLRPGANLGLLLLRGGGVATSGRDYRRWRQDGRWQHHLIDPRTGRPAQTDVLSATVVGPSVLAAEAAAKAALILGGRAGLDWLERRPALAGLLVLEDGRVLRSRRLQLEAL